MTSNVTPFRNVKHASMLWAAPERAEEIAALHAKLFDPPWDAECDQGLARTSGSDVAGRGCRHAEDRHRLRHWSACGGRGRNSVDRRFAELAACRRWHAGCFEGLSRAARRGDAKRIFLEVAEDNEAALALYRKLGFRRGRDAANDTMSGRQRARRCADARFDALAKSGASAPPRYRRGTCCCL